ncbi:MULTISPECIES: branched-chain amino acid ABC transporter permease [Aneurinibacillus]|uniref:Branched-chain amino acid ABC transporter permease n=1 Tax=Aneurinibacillus thermoaerophilus TaxID=143495 RepID=A0ABX8YCY6_ANETH|nr:MULTISPECIES: branched-chain amino acid ABC transporter permease [Aneurinibacillus]AMA74219.1 ABC transporter [Aneurinibacillus sp. XH2]MED0676787.1 branched-chain amino acid ABC transporter permease [Aneurinibacillus thermoaerophilus]MED0680999.1 branched-chain amino acid ABC transporter permease [Aneurinibacillus thermoaerophilus]MED0738586.1 branched-chain amino acid ABC transporter permease [Aneurinibacillus thermoaerophilus]MED0763000.1 branched-chain amino acid ABC transporter permeas
MQRKRAKGFWLSILLAIAFYAVIQYLISFSMLNTFYENTLYFICINIILAVSLHLVIGITGQFSIGHAGFLAVGAYISAICTMKLELPFSVALIAGGIVAAIAGLVVGIPSLRLKGDYLAIATLGFGEIIRITFLNIDYVGGASGMQVSHMTDWTTLFVCLLITIIVIINFTNSTHGRACISVREDEIAADAMGVNTTYYKVIAFVLGSFFAGIAGGLYAHNFYIIQPTNFGFLKSFDILIFVVLGGLGSMSGAVISAILLTIVSTFLQDYPETRMIIYSLVLIIVMIYRPQGLMGTKEITELFKKKRTGIEGGEPGGKHTAA